MKYPAPLATTAAVLLGFPAAFGQTPAPEETGTAEAVVITGSNLKRTDYEGPQTVAVYTAEKIAQMGARTVTEVIQRLPQNNFGLNENVSTGIGFSPGAAGVSLRGLGVSSTLVLLNGRRIAPFPFANNGTDSFVDLNSIPVSAVERIEILKEGASAVYGSDAVAGVVNVILKTNYSGGEEETYYGNTTNGDAGEFRQNFTTGIATEKFHLFLTGNYYHRDSISDLDRSYSTTADHRSMGGSDLRSSRSNPATIFVTDADGNVGSVTPKGGANGRPRHFADFPNVTPGDPNIYDYFNNGTLPDGNYRNRYNFNKNSELVPETERWGGLLTFGYNLTPHLEVFGEASYQSVETKTQVAPTPPDTVGDNLIVPASNPFNPFGQDLSFRWRSVGTGNRRDTVDLDAYRYVAGVKVKDLPYNWTAEGAVLYSESNVVDYSTDGDLSVEKTQQALNQTDPDKALNIFGGGQEVNRRSVLNPLIVHPRNDGLSYIWNYDVKASGDLFKVPAGAVSLGVGGEYREESLDQKFSAPAGSIVGFGGANSAGDRDVRSLFFEVSLPVTSPKWNIPLLRALEFSIAERYDDYSDFGSVAKPKFGFKWKPIEGLLFRGAYSEGFRAPSLPQLFTGVVNSFDTVTNPKTGLDGDVPITTGGDPNLQPETSYSYFLGAIIEPPFIKGLSIETDFYRIEQRNLVTQPAAQDIVDGIAPGVVTYASNKDISNISALFANLGTVVVDGVDFDITYKIPTRIGNFTFEHISAFINSYEQKQPGLDNLDLTDSSSLPEYKMVNSLFYGIGGFEAGVTVNYIDSYDDLRGNDKELNRTIGSWTTVDLQASYEWNFEPKEAAASYSKDGKTASVPPAMGLTGWQRLLNGTKLTIGVLNVGDAQPPFSNIEEGYDTQTADPTGRFVYASLRKKFW